jgi:hypothetical protein
MNDSVAAIVSAFFVIGIVGGVIAVIALSAIRAYRLGRPGGPDDRPEYRPGEPSESGWRVSAPGDRPRWPGDTDNDFSGR